MLDRKAQPADLGAPEVDIRTYVEVLLRRRWIAIGTLVAVIAVGALLTMRAPRIYQAKAALVIEPNTPEVLTNVREVYETAPGGWWAAKEYYETQYNVIRSRPVAQKAAA